MLTRMGHVAIKVKDIDASMRFYTEVLGLEEAFRMTDPDGTINTVYLYIAPSQFIELFPRGKTETQRGWEVIGVNHICYEVDDARAAYEEVKAKGAPIDAELKTGNSKCIMFFTHDPDGNSIEIMELPPESLQAQANKKFV